MLDGIGSIMLTADILLVFTLVHMVLGLQNLRSDFNNVYEISFSAQEMLQRLIYAIRTMTANNP